MSVRAEQTRTKLLKAAAEELVENKGHLEVAAVAKRAGTSIGLTYRYFPSKGALAAAVIDDFYDRHDKAVLLADIEADTWRDRERRRVELMVAFHYAEPLSPVAVGGLAREPEVAEVMSTRRNRQAAFMAAILAHGQDQGAVNPSLDTAILGPMVLGGIRQALQLGLIAAETIDPGEITQQILMFFEAITRTD